MSRITKEEVLQAANTLNEKGIKPTTNKVREILGKGSFSTIGAWLEEWAPTDQAIDEIPSIPSELNSAFSLLWSACYKESERILSSKIEELQISVDDQARELASSVTVIDGLEDELEAKEKAVILLNDRIVALTLDVQEANQKLSESVARVQMVEGQRDEMKAERDSWIEKATQWQSDAQEKAGMLKAVQSGMVLAGDLSKDSKPLAKPKASKKTALLADTQE